MMRIATSTFYQRNALEMTQQQSMLANIQTQIASGKRIQQAADDPAGYTTSVNINQGIGRLQQFQANMTLAGQRLGLAEQTLNSVTSVLQRVKELAIAAANQGTQSEGTRTAQRTELEQRFQELLGYANTREANGNYLFAGLQGKMVPFFNNNAGVSYQGDQGQLLLQVSPEQQLASNDSGYAVFQQIRNGNGTFAVDAANTNTGTGIIATGTLSDPSAYQDHTYVIQFTSDTSYDVIDTTTGSSVLTGQNYADGKAISFDGIESEIGGTPNSGDKFTITPSQNHDMFSIVRKFISVLNTNPENDRDRTQITQALNGIMDDLEQSMSHTGDVISAIGARQNLLDTIEEDNSAMQSQLKADLSATEDLDYASAISQLQLRQTTLQVLQQTYARIAGLSLFNNLR